MSRSFEDFKNPQRKLPDVALGSTEVGPESVRPSGRKSRVLVLLDGEESEKCRGYVTRLIERRDEIAEWDGEVRLVVPHTLRTEREEIAAQRPFTFRILEDPELRLASRLGIDHPGVVLADQWGVIRLLELAGPQHRFVDPGEIVEWLRFLAIECPECQGEAH